MENLPIISFLASHGGSSARAIIEAVHRRELAAGIGILVTNNRDAPILQWCREHGIEALHISGRTHGDEARADAAISSALQRAGTDLLVCSGYMKKVGPATLEAFSGRILNIHPALLPRHGGKGMYGDRVHQAVLAAGDDESGATVHIVTEGYDEGPILNQARVPVKPGDTVESLRVRVQSVEPGLYLETLREMLGKG